MLSSVLGALRNTGKMQGGLDSAHFYPAYSPKEIEAAECNTSFLFVAEIKVTEVLIKKHNIVLSCGRPGDDL